MLRRYQDTILYFLVLSLAVWVGLRQLKAAGIQPVHGGQQQVFFSSRAGE